LKEENGWAPDLDELKRAMTPKTKLIGVHNPNNPTGYILSDEEMRAIVSTADSVGARILAHNL
jgi:aspartate/methionine/tyrosine aminotransferase